MPVGGHRGPLPTARLYDICQRAAYSDDFRFVWNQLGVDRGAPPHCCGLNVGNWSMADLKSRKGLPPWQGPMGNVHMGIVPEWTIIEDIDDPESELYCLGWRILVVRWIAKNIIRLSTEVRSLLGPDYFRYLNPHRSVGSRPTRSVAGTTG